MDKYDIGTFFKDPANLLLSPLAPMYRKPVIIKADDLQARVSLGWRRDKTKLEVKKVGERQYHIDCSAAQYPHELETVEELLFMEEISSVKVLGE